MKKGVQFLFNVPERSKNTRFPVLKNGYVKLLRVSGGSLSVWNVFEYQATIKFERMYTQ